MRIGVICFTADAVRLHRHGICIPPAEILPMLLLPMCCAVVYAVTLVDTQKNAGVFAYFEVLS